MGTPQNFAMLLFRRSAMFRGELFEGANGIWVQVSHHPLGHAINDSMFSILSTGWCDPKKSHYF